MPITPTVLGSQGLALTAMSHPRGQAHCHLIRNRICGSLWWNYPVESATKGIRMGPVCPSWCCFLPAPPRPPFHPTHMESHLKPQETPELWPMEFRRCFLCRLLTDHISPFYLFYPARPSLCILPYVLWNEPRCSLYSFPLSIRFWRCTHPSTQLGPRDTVREPPGPCSSQEKSLILLLLTPHLPFSDGTHVPSEQTTEQKTRLFLHPFLWVCISGCHWVLLGSRSTSAHHGICALRAPDSRDCTTHLVPASLVNDANRSGSACGAGTIIQPPTFTFLVSGMTNGEKNKGERNYVPLVALCLPQWSTNWKDGMITG